jgi:Sulfatase-modifying factor enzyme 1
MRRARGPRSDHSSQTLGLYDMNGNVFQWVEDCYHDTYKGAPADRSAWPANCKSEEAAVLLGGSWLNGPVSVRPAGRRGVGGSRDRDVPTVVSVSRGRFQPEPARPRFRWVRTKRPGPSMMSTDAAATM